MSEHQAVTTLRRAVEALREADLEREEAVCVEALGGELAAIVARIQQRHGLTAAPTSEPVTFSSLPHELIALILSFLPSPTDVARASRVSTLIHGHPPPRHTSLVERALCIRAEKLRLPTQFPPEQSHAARVQAMVRNERARSLQSVPVFSQSEFHSVAVSKARQLLVWGEVTEDNLADAREEHEYTDEDVAGILGLGGALGVYYVDAGLEPTVVGSLRQVRMRTVSAGHVHTVAVSELGRCYTFGCGKEGRLGHGDEEPRYAPKVVQALENIPVVAAAAGWRHSLFLTARGEVYSCGDAHSIGRTLAPAGPGGAGSSEEADWSAAFTPRPIAELAGVRITTLSARGDANLAVDSRHRLFAWGGLNQAGQLGFAGAAAAAEHVLPRLVPALVGVPVVGASAGQYHSVAVCADGALYSWGSNDDGQLGHGDREPREEPTPVTALNGVFVVSASAGVSGTAVVTADGAVYTWGNSTDPESSELEGADERRETNGHGPCTDAESLVPRRVRAALDGAFWVDAGPLSTLVADAAGRVQGWGWRSAIGLEDSGGESDDEVVAPTQYTNLAVPDVDTLLALPTPSARTLNTASKKARRQGTSSTRHGNGGGRRGGSTT